MIRGPCNMISGLWNVNRVPCNVNRGTRNVIMGPWNVLWER